MGIRTPRPVSIVRNARVPGHTEVVDITIGDGRIAAVGPAGPARCDLGPDDMVDAGGRVVLPAFVDAHVHLDKVFQLGDLADAALPLGSLGDALASTAQVQAALAPAVRLERATRAALAMAAGGTAAARVHVEIDAIPGAPAAVWHARLAGELDDVIDLQLVAFPQHGWTGTGDETDAMTAAMEAAMQHGCDVVGGCPYADVDPTAHIKAVFDLAGRWDAPVDFHIDFTDDPTEHWVDAVVDETIRRGWAGRVVVGHLTSLAAMTPTEAQRRIERLAAAGVGVVSLPATDLYLGGRQATHARPRGVTPLRELDAAGVTVALGTNNLQNAFTPYGDGSLPNIAWLAGLVGHFGTAAEQARLLDMITANPARLLGREPPAVIPGARADLVVIDTTQAEDAVRAPARIACVLHAGAIVTRPDPDLTALHLPGPA